MSHRIGRARWVFDRTSWTPTLEELSLALSSVQKIEKDRIMNYEYFKDAIASLSGRLLMRKFVSDATGLKWDDFLLSREDRYKPFYANDAKIQFNVSHHGNLTVLAGETGGTQIGIDVMEMKYTGGKPLKEFFRLMSRQLTSQEWEAVEYSSLESQKEKTFFRIWALKEAYVKATGVGLNLPFNTVDFRFRSKLDQVGSYVEDTEVYFKGIKQDDWRFQEVLLNENLCVCVAIHCPPDQLNLYPALPFQTVSFQDMIQNCRPIIPTDEDGCKRMLDKYQRDKKMN
uniref:L-aminoadipate-semialdehyde dehydrogenase-phosphopantetheinyl transferase n=1 Tax=Lygus hesperus TaxID=30085 RepID=A0A0K8SQH9_LYGHE